MEAFSALLAICAGNSPVTGIFPAQRPVTQSFDSFFDLRHLRRYRALYDVIEMNESNCISRRRGRVTHMWRLTGSSLIYVMNCYMFEANFSMQQIPTKVIKAYFLRRCTQKITWVSS